MSRWIVSSALFLMVVAAWVPGWIFDPTSSEVTTTLDKVWAASFLAFPLVGLFLTRRLPANPVGWLFLIGPALVGAGVSLEEFGESSGRQLSRMSDVVFETGLIAMFASILLFPDGRYPNHWFRNAHLTGIIAFAVVAAMNADLGLVIVFNLSLPVAALIVRWARGVPLVRRQIAGPVAVALVGLVLIGGSALLGLLGVDDRWGTLVGTVAFLVLTIGIPASIGIAITRYRLYEIDRIISRTLSYTLVVGLLAVVFAAGVVWIPSALDIGDSPLLVAASTLVVAALFNPVRKRVHGWVDRRFNRSHFDAERVMDGFAGSLRDEVDPDEVMDGWVGVVEETMQPSSVGVWVKE